MTKSKKLERAIRELRKVLRSSLKKIEKDVARAKADVNEATGKRKTLAEALSLTHRLYEIFDDARNYPTWTRHGGELVCELVSDVEVSEADQDHCNVGVTLQGQRYSFSWKSTNHQELDPEDSPAEGGKLTLADVDGRVLYAASLARYWGDSDYDTVDIRAFMPGQWVISFVELSEHVRVLHAKASLGWRKKILDDERQAVWLRDGDAELKRVALRFGLRPPDRSYLLSTLPDRHRFDKCLGSVISNRKIPMPRVLHGCALEWSNISDELAVMWWAQERQVNQALRAMVDAFVAATGRAQWTWVLKTVCAVLPETFPATTTIQDLRQRVKSARAMREKMRRRGWWD